MDYKELFSEAINLLQELRDAAIDMVDYESDRQETFALQELNDFTHRINALKRKNESVKSI